MSEPRNVVACVLAAGASRRLGTAKQLVMIDGQALLRRTVLTVMEAGCPAPIIVTGAAAAAVAACVADLPVRIVHNASWDTGMASSIYVAVHTALRASPSLDGLLLLVCDQPHLNVLHLRQLLERFAVTGLTVGSFYRRDPSQSGQTNVSAAAVPAIFPASRCSELLLLQGDHGARSLLVGADGVEWPQGRVDIDTAEDLAHFLSDM